MKVNIIKLIKKINNLSVNINNNNNINNNKYHNNKIINNNQWNIVIYNYNKNIEITNLINNNIVTKLLYKIINVINNNNVFISRPTFKHNINTVEIKLYYYVINNNINNINMGSIINKLSIVLSHYYNKLIIINPVKLLYVYMDHNIFQDYIIYLINNSQNSNGSLYNIDKVINNYINNINNIIPLNIYNNNNIKYLTGWSIILKGKLIEGRSSYISLINGSLNSLNNNIYKLNITPSRLYKSSINPLYLNVNKDGKYNINVKLNYSSK